MTDDKASPEDTFYRDPVFAQFYDCNFRSDRDDFIFCRQLASSATSVLDLGCGTGTLLAQLSGERVMSGVDPAGAMLDIARQRPGGDRVTWIEADARTVRLDRQFDLVLLTGHAFQVFLTSEDQTAVLETIACHLSPGGRFVFDTRNPLLQAWKNWIPEKSRERIDHPDHGPVEVWNDAAHDPATGIVTYETHYRVLDTGITHTAESQIAFPAQRRVEELIDAADLAVDQWYGDWQGNPLRDDRPEIIPIGRLRQN
ncbi:MAG: class I SAM-dependent methyltransferase [Alphaproteobacteria bacterium]|nr:class I SAM-dependent methyltransferase [Alphaproteobacteria bacterium]